VRAGVLKAPLDICCTVEAFTPNRSAILRHPRPARRAESLLDSLLRLGGRAEGGQAVCRPYGPHSRPARTRSWIIDPPELDRAAAANIGIVVLKPGMVAQAFGAVRRRHVVLKDLVELEPLFHGLMQRCVWSHANDPHEEHDFGAFEVEGHKIFFKIDYYDATLTCHSPDASDPAVTKRVITIMLAEEY
jgi:hypothetical protein